MNKAPLALPALSLAVGIYAGSFCNSFLCGMAPIAASVLILFLLNRRGRDIAFSMKWNRLHYLWIALLFIGIGSIEGVLSNPVEIDTENGILPPYLSGTVVESDMRTDGCRMIVDMDSFEDFNGHRSPCGNLKVLVYDKTGATRFSRIRIPAELRRLDSIKALGLSSFYASLRQQGINYCINATENSLQITGRETGMIPAANALRDRITIAIEKSHLHPRVGNFLISIALGDRSFLDYQTRKRFSNAGLAHILALSGLHVGILSGLLLFLLFPTGLVCSYKWKYAAVILLIWIYTFITGLSPSAVRASIMVSITFLAIFLERKNNFVNALFAAVFVILILWPRSLYDIGFQLSVLCTLSLLVFSGKLEIVGHRSHPALYRLSALILTTLVATGAGWCLAARYFHIFPLAFFLSNIVIVPFMPLYMSLSFAYMVCLMSGHDPAFIRLPLESGYTALEKTIDFCSGHGSAVLEIYPGIFSVILWIAGISLFALALHFPRRRKLFSWCATSSLSVSLLLVVFFPEKPESSGIMVYPANGHTSLRVYSDNNLTSADLDPGMISVYKAGNIRIGWIDFPVNASDSHTTSKLKSCDLLVLSSGSRMRPHDLTRFGSNKKIVVCSPFDRDFDRTLAHGSRKIGMDIYSVEESGPFIMHF